ncbi:hypothetical protein [Neobacillus rhizophilus]|nr:hypothetical protein [Neobacillus rhizophilus]
MDDVRNIWSRMLAFCSASFFHKLYKIKDVYMNLTSNSILHLVPIEIHKDKKHYIVEAEVSGEFYEMPEVCIDAINLMNKGESLGRTEKLLKEKYPTEEIDILDFAQQLLELHLIAEMDGVKLDPPTAQKSHSGFLWVPQKLGQFFFNRYTNSVYSVLFLGCIVLFVLNPSLFPHYKDLFIFDLMVLNIPAWLVLSFLLVLIHEFGHVLAIRAYQLPTKLEIGHRLFLVVLETDMSSSWKLPAKDRNVLYLAGLRFDTVILFFALIGQSIFPVGSGIFLSVLKVVVLDTFIRMVYQCCIYMKTDLYYVFENTTGAYNLIENAQQVFRNLFTFIKPARQKEVMFEEEKGTVFTYTIFYVLGVGLTLSLFFGYYLPQVLFAMTKIHHCFHYGPSTYHFWDAALSSLQLLIGFLLLLYSLRKKYIKKQNI